MKWERHHLGVLGDMTQIRKGRTEMTLSFVRCECSHFKSHHSKGGKPGPAKCYGISPDGKPCDCDEWKEAVGEQY